MLSFLYGLPYAAMDQKLHRGLEKHDRLFQHLIYYSMADKYGIPTMSAEAGACFAALQDAGWDKPVMLDVLKMALAVLPTSDTQVLNSLVQSMAIRADLLIGIDKCRDILAEHPNFIFRIMVHRLYKTLVRTGISRFCSRCCRTVTSTTVKRDLFHTRICPRCRADVHLEPCRITLWTSNIQLSPVLFRNILEQV